MVGKINGLKMTASISFSVSIHRNEIMAAAIHEYTDWERPIQVSVSKYVEIKNMHYILCLNTDGTYSI